MGGFEERGVFGVADTSGFRFDESGSAGYFNLGFDAADFQPHIEAAVIAGAENYLFGDKLLEARDVRLDCVCSLLQLRDCINAGFVGLSRG